MREKKGNIIFIFKLPPPVNGATTANNTIYRSEFIKSRFNSFFIDYGLSNSSKDFGKYSVSKFIHYLLSILNFFKLILLNKIDLVYITVAPRGIAFIKDSIFILLSKLFLIKTLVHLHGKGINKTAIKSRIWKWYYKKVFNKVNIICLSNKLKEDVDFLSLRNTYIVPNGINMKDYMIVPDHSEDIPVILYLSNLYTKKGVVDFVETMEVLSTRKLKFEAWIVGDSTYDLTVAELEEIISQKQLGNWVKVLGPKYGVDKVNVLRQSKIFLFPTRWPNEAFPISIIEAMCVGLPVITTDEGGIPDMVENNVNGFIVDNKDHLRISVLIEKLLSNVELYKKISDNNIQKVTKNYTQEHFLENIIDAINSSINETTNPAT